MLEYIKEAVKRKKSLKFRLQLLLTYVKTTEGFDGEMYSKTLDSYVVSETYDINNIIQLRS